MRQSLKVKLFGNPEIYLDGQLITFPFAKINALFFYLLINKNVSRDEIAGMLWPNKPEASAKKNLRNTIYQANKTLNDEYIISLSNQILSLNSELEIELDVEKFMNSQTQFDEYSGEFLKGFYVKDSESYDLWMTKMRSYYEKRYTDLLYISIDKDLDAGKTTKVERNIQKLIAIDEYNERNYQLLMTYYRNRGLNSKVIEVYLHVADLLNNELGISPSDELTAIYRQTIEQVKTQTHLVINKMPEYYFSRPEEIAIFEKRLTKFVETQENQGVLIEGETGNGKTEFVNRILGMRQKEFNRIDVRCHPTLSRKDGHVWRNILISIGEQLNVKNIKFEDLNIDFEKVSDSVIEEHFDKLNKLYQTFYQNEHLIIVIDQFECIDEISLHLLNQFMLLQVCPVFFVLVGNGQWSYKVSEYVHYLTREKFIDRIVIDSLSEDETKHLIQRILGEHEISEKEIQKIYDHSGGNLQFINEMVKLIQTNKAITTLTPSMKESIEKQCYYLSEASLEVLETLSFFQKGVSISLLSKILSFPTMKLKKELVELFRRGLIVEVKEDNDEDHIRIHKLRIKHYFYQNQTQTVRHLMHNRIAEMQEKQLKFDANNIESLRQIAYHYRMANQDLKALKFELDYLHQSLRFKHELFPVYNQEYSGQGKDVELTPEEIEEKFSEIREELNKVESKYQVDSTFLALQLNFLYIEGRYFIRLGEYERGIENILQTIVKAKDINETDYLLRAYLQMIYYCIQINNSEDMIHYIELALDVAIYANNHESIGILLRLKGLYYIMIGQLTIAEKFILDSISTLTLNDALERKFSVNIAAAYDYLAEIEFIRGNYLESIKLESKSLNYSKDMNADSSQVVFNINMGVYQFANQDYEEALKYLMTALEISNTISSIWKRTQLFAYLAVSNAMLNYEKNALKYLALCEKENYKKENGRDLGIISWTKLVLYSQKILLNEKKQKIDEKQVKKWASDALKYLSPYRDTFEMKYVEENFI